ncbi:MAG: Gfo/Idh/MocA family oxidoreductase [Planctomycetaceae bacterium]|nr:Gfo/Idh/MocA family oxidoreductase [Planctomycetaceae bacterium]
MQNAVVGSVASSLALATSGNTVEALNQKLSSRIKVGQIGTKHAHAGGQMQTLRKLSDLYEVVGVVEHDDAQYKQIAESPVCRGVPRLSEQELLETPGLKVVAVETEVRDLLSTSQKCIDAGLHIHLDKPAGESFPQLEILHQTAKDKSLTIQMGYMFRYNPAFQFLFQAVQNGWLGEVFEVHGVMSKKVGEATRRQLAGYPGGAMFELGCHLIDPLLHILGIPENVTSYNRQTIKNDPLFDNMLAVFEYPRATATIRSSVVEVNGGRRRQFIVCGTQGTIEILPLEPGKLILTLEEPQGKYRKGTQEIALPASPGRYHGCWTEFASIIRGKSKLPFSHKHDLAVQKSVLTASGIRTWK